MGYFFRIRHLALFLVLIFSTFLYMYKLDVIPHGFYLDEALQGYNAYSLLLTGKDEFGQSFPLAFKFFGTFTPPLYTYLTVPSIKIFGLTVFATRFVSALSGVMSVFVIYLLLKSLNFTSQKKVLLIGVLLFAISPWEVLFARSGYEANLGLLGFLLSAYFLWKGLAKGNSLILGLIISSLTIYTSFTARFLMPIFLVSYILLFKKELLEAERRNHLIKGLIAAFVIQLPNLYLLTTPSFFIKNKLFYSHVLTDDKGFSFLPKFINISINLLYEFFSQYLSYFSPRSLFLHSDPDPQRSIPTLSVLYSWMTVPYLIGISKLWKYRKKLYTKYIILLAATSPIPAALVGDPFSSYRALPLLIPLILIIVLGLDSLIKRYLNLSLIILTILISISLVSLWRGYFVFFPIEKAEYWNYGFNQLAVEIKKYPNEKFLIDLGHSGPIYINLAFFLQSDPLALQQTADLNTKQNYYSATKFNSEKSFNNIEVRSIQFGEDVYKDKIIVGDLTLINEQSIKEHKLTKLFEIFDPKDKLLMIGAKTNPTQKRGGI